MGTTKTEAERAKTEKKKKKSGQSLRELWTDQVISIYIHNWIIRGRRYALKQRDISSNSSSMFSKMDEKYNPRKLVNAKFSHKITSKHTS